MTDRDRVHVVAAAELIGEERRRHEDFMERALRQARRNPDPPFGAVIVERASGRLLAEAVNAVHESPILHGKTGAIDAYARSHPRVSWPELTLYTTAEPCPMCAAAIAWTRIGEVVIGTDMETISRLGISQIHIACTTVLRAAPFYQSRLIVGILADRTDTLYADWAARLRLLRELPDARGAT
jgi:tRNA(Arg) A34 adenosine deaminase TadA